jgi:alpha-galactosidase
MGWNSWNIYASKVTQELVLANAKAMVSSGLIDHGWSYMNIDDVWQGKRGGKYNGIMPNDSTFPDMQALVDAIHKMGLKAGILFNTLGRILWSSYWRFCHEPRRNI